MVDDAGDSNDEFEPVDPDDDARTRGILRKAAAAAKGAATGAVGFVADKRFERTPVGRARAAAENDAATFHIRLDLAGITYRSSAKGGKTTEPDVADAIGQIEAEGWRLDHIEYLTEADEWERTHADGSVTRGSTPHSSAILLFRRS